MLQLGRKQKDNDCMKGDKGLVSRIKVILNYIFKKYLFSSYSPSSYVPPNPVTIIS